MKIIAGVGLVIVMACAALTYRAINANDRAVEPKDAAKVNAPAPNLPQVLKEHHLSGVNDPATAAPVVRRLRGGAYPPPDAPWSDVFQALMPLAMDGDSVAASRLFRQTIQCRSFPAMDEVVDRWLRMYKDSDNTAPRVLKTYDIRLAKLQRDIETHAPVCRNVDPERLDDVLYPVMLQAAKLGNKIAAQCYVRAFQFQTGNYTDAERTAMKDDYVKHALDIAQTGIERGNWEMVGLLRTAYNRVPKQFRLNRWLDDVIQPDMLKYYAYSLLVRKGELSAR